MTGYEFCRVLAVSLLAIPLSSGEPGARVDYVGGTLEHLKARTEGRLASSDPYALVLSAKGAEVRVNYDDVNVLEYGQQAGRRYVLALTISPVLLLSKARRHFLTIGYKDSDGRQQAMVFQVHKNDLRALLASLEARTGRRVEYQDGEARKAGGG